MILFIERELFPLDDSELNCGRKYSNKIVFSVFNSLKEGLKIKDITSATNVPETTIRNWKFGYSNLFKTNKKLDDKLKKETLELLKDGCSIPYISKKLKVNYDEIRLFLKKELDDYTYSTIKASDRKLQNDSKILTSDLSYILGVMYGDGYFNGNNQIGLGTKDRDFMEYFSYILKKWCNKKPSKIICSQNTKPYYKSLLSFKDANIFIKKVVENRDKIPKQILASNNKKIFSMFIKGFSDSEGSIVILNGKYGTIKISNQNTFVLNQIRNMMIKLGFDKDKIKIVLNNKSKNGYVYILRICSRNQLELFNQKIGFTIKRKQYRLEACLKNNLNINGGDS